MPVVALALFAVFAVLGFGWRSWLQHRRTGSTGFRGVTGRVGSVEWFAGVGLRRRDGRGVLRTGSADGRCGCAAEFPARAVDPAHRDRGRDRGHRDDGLRTGRHG